MRRYHTILFSILVIVCFPQNSESLLSESCRESLFDFNKIQARRWETIQELHQENMPVEVNHHSKTGSTPELEKIGDSGSLFLEASKRCLENSESFESADGETLYKTCPFRAKINCNNSAIYRTFDGSCNNLEQPYWGRAKTPYRRLQTAYYADGIEKPRCKSVDGNPLPGPRDITIDFHRMSDTGDLDKELTHLIMSFGQFLNHELGSTVLFNNAKIDCCGIDRVVPCPDTSCKNCANKVFYERCLPMTVPENDPYFSQYLRTCLKFSRALPTPNLQCKLGPKEQLNAQTSYIDCSQVYGVSRKEANSLRTMNRGLLKITPTKDLDLMPHNNKFCRTPKNYCFIAGDFRVNQNFMLVSMHTLFLREHNRVAKLLAQADPSLDDENLFQKARQIVIAQAQHIIYNEYLPHVIGKPLMKTLGLDPLTKGYTRYNPKTQAGISNAHVGAAFRFGHSSIRRSFSNGRGKQILLSPTFGLTDPFYQPGDAASGFVTGLVNDRSQKTDRLLTDQVVDKLFERSPGQGDDLASRNIQRGRDIGLRPYTQWRKWCGLSVPNNFKDGLTDHSKENRDRLWLIYQSVHDIDLWTGGLSEKHLDGASVGPTFACILDQLETIRSTTLSRIFCDNTHIKRIQKDPFLLTKKPENDLVNCNSLAALDICPFVRRWSGWSDWSASSEVSRSRTRKCVAPVKGPCACKPNQIEIEEASSY